MNIYWTIYSYIYWTIKQGTLVQYRVILTLVSGHDRLDSYGGKEETGKCLEAMRGTDVIQSKDSEQIQDITKQFLHTALPLIRAKIFQCSEFVKTFVIVRLICKPLRNAHKEGKEEVRKEKKRKKKKERKKERKKVWWTMLNYRIWSL